MDSIKYKIKFISNILLSAFITLIFSLATGIAAQLINLNAEVAINYEAPLTLISGPDFNSILRNNYNSATSIVFDYGDDYENIINNATSQTIVDTKQLGYSNGGISLYYNSTNATAYVLAKGKILANSSCYQMFYKKNSLESIVFGNFFTNDVTNMYYMFYTCYRLTSLDVSKFNTSKVTYMGSMFASCRGLTSLDLTSFNTSNVTNMNSMFFDCRALITIYVSDLWNTSAVTTSSSMFSGCSALVGGNGTKCADVGVYDKTYAKNDEEGSPGYLTYKAN